MKNAVPIAVSMAVVEFCLVIAVFWWFLRNDAPPPVSLEAAAGGVISAPADVLTTAAPTSASPQPTIDGTWVIDARSGDFDFDTATGTFAGFRVDEVLAGIGSATAVGRTGLVSGTMLVDGTWISSVSVTIDLTALVTNDARRDAKVQSALETSRYPDAEFVLAEPIDVGQAALEGAPVTVEAVGDLTIGGVTQSMTVSLRSQLVGHTIVVVGSFDITFADFEVEVPSSPAVLSVDDRGVLEMQLLFERS